MAAPLKKQKLGALQATATPPIPHTKYEASPVTLINFPSSVMNGVTAEHGLYSLTFKSISCYKLVGNLDMMRRVLVGQREDSSKSESTETESRLQSMLARLREPAPAPAEAARETTDSITTLHKEIDLAKVNETDILSLKRKIASVCDRDHGHKQPAHPIGKPIPVSNVKIPGLEVCSIDQVLNMDMSVYGTA